MGTVNSPGKRGVRRRRRVAWPAAKGQEGERWHEQGIWLERKGTWNRLSPTEPRPPTGLEAPVSALASECDLGAPRGQQSVPGSTVTESPVPSATGTQTGHAIDLRETRYGYKGQESQSLSHQTGKDKVLGDPLGARGYACLRGMWASGLGETWALANCRWRNFRRREGTPRFAASLS